MTLVSVLVVLNVGLRSRVRLVRIAARDSLLTAKIEKFRLSRAL